MGDVLPEVNSTSIASDKAAGLVSWIIDIRVGVFLNFFKGFVHFPNFYLFIFLNFPGFH